MTKGSLRTLLREKSSMVSETVPKVSVRLLKWEGTPGFLVWLPSNHWPQCASAMVSVFRAALRPRLTSYSPCRKQISVLIACAISALLVSKPSPGKTLYLI